MEPERQFISTEVSPLSPPSCFSGGQPGINILVNHWHKPDLPAIGLIMDRLEGVMSMTYVCSSQKFFTKSTVYGNCLSF